MEDGNLSGGQPSSELTPRVHEILKLAADGLAYKEIGALMKTILPDVQGQRFQLVDMVECAVR